MFICATSLLGTFVLVFSSIATMNGTSPLCKCVTFNNIDQLSHPWATQEMGQLFSGVLQKGASLT